MRDEGSGQGIEALIVGAGPAGLAVGACLKRAGITAVILEQSNQVGSAWRGHYERLHLHTARGGSALPFAPMPAAYPRYPSRQQVVDYLEDYANRLAPEIRFGEKVTGAQRQGDHWVVTTDKAVCSAPNLVIASGYTRQPYSPTWPGQAGFKGKILHSSQYKNADPFKGQKVLVVGFGNSGGEIAIDLVEAGAGVSLAVRGPINVIPRDLFGIPIQSIAILERWLPPALVDALNAPILGAVIGDLRPYGLAKLPNGPVSQINGSARIPLIDIGTVRLIKQRKITVYPGIDHFTKTGVVFADGREVVFDAVILATGYRPRVDAILGDAASDCVQDGMPLTSGQEAGIKGLYFCGYNVRPTGMLREIALEARRIGAAISRAKSA